MSKTPFFFHRETNQLFDLLEEISRKSGVSRGRAFEDMLNSIIAALAAETMEEEYFKAIESHTKGKKGSRSVDLFPKFFAALVDAASNTDNDVLGDLFQGSISYGEHGLYITPQPVAAMMSQLVCGESKTSDGYQLSDMSDSKIRICDPACGSGLMLMEAGKSKPRAELYGQDIDLRCVQMTAINLAIRGKYGWAVWGSTLSLEKKRCYRLGSFFHESPNGLRRGVIRVVPPDLCPFPFTGEAEKEQPKKKRRRRRKLFD